MARRRDSPRHQLPSAICLARFGYVLVPIVVFWLWLRRPRPADVLSPRSGRGDPDRRLLAVLLWAPLLLPAIVAPFIAVELTSLWTMQAWFLLPILLLMPVDVVVRRDAAVAVAAGVAAFTLIALLISPALAWIRHQQGNREAAPIIDRLRRK